MVSVIEAAGAVIWRPGPGTSGTAGSPEPEVCLIHRPKYDDWSFPKGKLTPRESLAHAAVREVAEETGLAIRLGAHLAQVHYPLHADGSEGLRNKARKAGKHRTRRAKVKQVDYWVGQVVDEATSLLQSRAFGSRPLRDEESDTVVWLPVSEATDRLSYASDRAVLESMTFRPSATVVLLRHGKAESRKSWPGTDADRPLTPLGAAAAYALMRELASYGVTQLVTSPWVRCSQTLIPYGLAIGRDLTEATALTEETAEHNPQESRDYLRSLLRQAVESPEQAVVACTHRPVLAELLPELSRLAASRDLAAELPTDSPYVQTAEGLVLSVEMPDDEPVITAIGRLGAHVY